MALTINNCTIVGRVAGFRKVAKPEWEGDCIYEVSLACDEGWGDDEYTSFIPITFFASPAQQEWMERELVNGNIVGAVGSFHQNRWEDEDGNLRSRIVIRARQVEFFGRKQRKENVKEVESETDKPVKRTRKSTTTKATATKKKAATTRRKPAAPPESEPVYTDSELFGC